MCEVYEDNTKTYYDNGDCAKNTANSKNEMK